MAHQGADLEEDWAVLQVDVSNAFNTLDRRAMLEGCLKKTPKAYNWLAWCYSTPCDLFCDGQVIAQSTLGVHQGDAMGPLAFSLGLDVALDQCAHLEAGLPWSAWYLDDGVLVGHVEALRD